MRAKTSDMDIAWGWWQATPNFQLGGGYYWNTGSLQAGVDWQHNLDLDGGGFGFTNTSNEQIRLTWSARRPRRRHRARLRSASRTTTPVAPMRISSLRFDEDDVEEKTNSNSKPKDDFCASSAESDIPQIGGYFLWDGGGGLQLTGAASWQKDESEVTVFSEGDYPAALETLT